MSEIETLEVETDEQNEGDTGEFPPVDHLVKCNSCGFVRRKSDPSGCQNGHKGGWSYAGPIPEDDPLLNPPEGIALMGVAEFLSRGGDPTREEIESVEAELAETDEPEDEADPSSLDKIIEANARVTVQKARVEEAKAVLKDHKERLEELHDALNYLINMAALDRANAEPDPARYPLLDGPKAEINATFAKPEAVQPLPPDTYDEYRRRMARDTGINQVGVDAATVNALAAAGIETVADFLRKSDALAEANASLTTIKGITPARLDRLADALFVVTGEWLESWADAHPEAGGDQS